MKSFFRSHIGRTIASAMALGSLESCEREPVSLDALVDTAKPEKKPFSHTALHTHHERKRGQELFPKEELMKQEFFFVLQNMDVNLVRPSLPKDLQQAPERQILEYLKQSAIGLSLHMEECVRERRFANGQDKERYFDALLDETQKKKIVQAIKRAVRYTGVPEEVLLGIGLIESQWNPQAERKDTEVYGPMQMKLSTAEAMAKKIHSNQLRFGKQEIIIDTPEDLKRDMDVAVLLAAEYLRTLYMKYGQWGLAAAAYSSGEGALDTKIQTFFPDVELGTVATRKRENHSKALTKLKEERRKCQEQLLRDPDNSILKKMIEEIKQQQRTHNEGYTRNFAEEQQLRMALPVELARHGVCAQTLCMKDTDASGDPKHSLQYPLMLDALIRIALPYYKAP